MGIRERKGICRAAVSKPELLERMLDVGTREYRSMCKRHPPAEVRFPHEYGQGCQKEASLK